MITPIELQSKTFKSGIGYDKKDVDNFLNELLRGYEVTYKENLELKDKINTLNDGISYYKSIENTLQKALVLAEQTAEETKNSARQRAKAIEDEARANAQLIVADAKKEYDSIKQQTIQLIRQYEAYKAQFKHLAASQCELLESESFNIHIADLDVFTSKSYSELATNEDKTKEESVSDTIKNYYNKDMNESSNNEKLQKDTEEDFEFFNLED